MALELKADERGGDQVLVAEDVRLVIGDRVLLEDFSARVERGDVIGLVGPNGAGKSTLLRAILGERTTDGGTIRIGESIRVDYYRQDLGQVPMDRTLFDVIHDLRPQWDRGKVQGHLGRFGFHADEVQRRAETLSGGERARVALAIMMLSGANFLVFDEPTNHLDVETIEALEDAIEAFDGTVLLVSHDRALLRALVTRVWALRDGRIHDFPGTFAEWRGRRGRAAGGARAGRGGGGRPAASARRRTPGGTTRSEGSAWLGTGRHVAPSSARKSASPPSRNALLN